MAKASETSTKPKKPGVLSAWRAKLRRERNSKLDLVVYAIRVSAVVGIICFSLLFLATIALPTPSLGDPNFGYYHHLTWAAWLSIVGLFVSAAIIPLTSLVLACREVFTRSRSRKSLFLNILWMIGALVFGTIGLVRFDWLGIALGVASLSLPLVIAWYMNTYVRESHPHHRTRRHRATRSGARHRQSTRGLRREHYPALLVK